MATTGGKPEGAAATGTGHFSPEADSRPGFVWKVAANKVGSEGQGCRSKASAPSVNRRRARGGTRSLNKVEDPLVLVDNTENRSATSSALASITARHWGLLALVLVMYLSAVAYVAKQGLSFRALFLYGLLQPTGVPEEEARLVEIATPLSWNLAKVAWFVYIKASAVLIELFQYWVVGMLIAAALVTFVSWEKVKRKMGYGGLLANFMAAGAGAVIPIVLVVSCLYSLEWWRLASPGANHGLARGGSHA